MAHPAHSLYLMDTGSFFWLYSSSHMVLLLHIRSNSFSFKTINSLSFLLLLVSYCFCNNYHKLSGIKHHKIITLQVWRSEVHSGFHWARINQGVGRSVFLLEPLGDPLFPCFFHLQKSCSDHSRLFFPCLVFSLNMLFDLTKPCSPPITIYKQPAL